MRALILVRPKFPLPVDQASALIDAFAGWREQHRPQMETFDFFTSGGGCGIANVSDEMALMRMVATFPFAPFSEIETLPLVEGDAALQAFAEIMRQMAAGMGGRS